MSELHRFNISKTPIFVLKLLHLAAPQGSHHLKVPFGVIFSSCFNAIGTDLTIILVLIESASVCSNLWIKSTTFGH